MTDEEIHNIYLHMSGKAEGLVEANGTADFPVLFARAILEYGGLTKDMQNMASKSTYKEQLETKDEPFEYWNAVEGWVKLDEVREHFESVNCGTIYKNGGEGRVPLYTTPQRTWVGLTDEQILHFVDTHVGAPSMDYPLDNSDWINFARAIEAAHGIKETP